MNKKKVIGLSLFSLILLLFVIILYSNKYKKQVYTEEGNNQIRTGTNISMMLETKAGSGDYEPSTSSEWPTEGYKFNEELSRCENGSTLSWDDTKKVVVVSGNLSDKCYVYFDIYSPPLTILEACDSGNSLASCITSLADKSESSITNIYKYL